MSIKRLTQHKLFKILTNPYLVILTIFIIWMIFFDENSLINHYEFNKEIQKLESEKEYYKSQIEQDTLLINKLKDKEELEKFAREKYHMKKDNEDVFLIEFDTVKK